MKMTLNLRHKLVVSILKKGYARKVVKAAKEAGAEGATILFARGTGIHEKNNILGITNEPEKEVVLILIEDEKEEETLNRIVPAGKLDRPGYGISFVLPTKGIGGIVHLMDKLQDGQKNPEREGERIVNEDTGKEYLESSIHYDLIVSIVNKGQSEKVVDASWEAGAEGGTILNGRGTGIHEKAKLFSIPIEPEKEVILTLIDRNKTEQVLTAITEKAELDKPGKGIAFVLGVDKTVGINHILNKMVNEKFKSDKKMKAKKNTK
ncbi:P-II family nitrogen regulator [Thalassorhabdus alkalitolerans]|uniref:P-II family nitrogen regulator n=1 Tax=Thalassorhabdus alkalitolerans TaxID=2282697 RepID=A0ABW0YLP0_9BACI|nr:P-II family nitrogen regulator [Thalassobacillus sp. C254]